MPGALSALLPLVVKADRLIVSLLRYTGSIRYPGRDTRLHLRYGNCIDETMVLDDCTLVQKVLNGDKRFFDELVSRHAARIFQLVYRFFNNRHQVEDIVQDVLLQAYQSLGGYGGERPFSSWLKTIAVRSCYQELALRSKRAESDLPELSWVELDTLDQLCLHRSSICANPETALIARDITARLLQALPAREQMVLIMRDVEGLNVRETARMLGITQIYVKVAHYRARKKARAVLAGLENKHGQHKPLQEKRLC
jgi:RNA polymerase sigma-70 factor (ECF subfamily)